MRKLSTTPKVSLVGAGPGDPDLISVKGLKAIQQADVILHDALANDLLLEEAKPEAILISVGKRAGKHRYSQAEIQHLMLQHALQHGHVVRLKGGDPFIFGRGYEELSYLTAFDVETEVIPGISSLSAVPGTNGIPLTARGVNESFWAITATTSSGALSGDVYLAARSTATVVIFMGMRKLGEIVEIFKRLGKSQTPIAVIQSGTLPEENRAIGTIDTIEALVKRKQLGTPALIVIGEVVKLHPDLSHESVVEYGLTSWRSQ
ncbi:uroporphyrinogen-III C-methyltransferase [Pontibacter sp. G13]|uniref:uroporphyrinogen-III C-methyltransferase n=1 Tax=Pontibacter sp. G13 TaxID=3074898 RepID=UPI00288972C9|nr:uroporphyrinogen-III C-methyltransferase [Pontibacter sp. G13]WNJ19188.1 uroporphyrinogen-III C-methyltransferase [Pontibacter sp. G13]